MKKILLMLLCVSVLGCSKNSVESEKPVDVLLIGGGIMSATLGTYLNELEPGWTIEMVERLDKVAEESSNGWNNAGTGHSAFCELNYTSEAADGSMDISKAVAINENFEISKQFWAYQVDRKVLNDPKSFINNVLPPPLRQPQRERSRPGFFSAFAELWSPAYRRRTLTVWGL